MSYVIQLEPFGENERTNESIASHLSAKAAGEEHTKRGCERIYRQIQVDLRT